MFTFAIRHAKLVYIMHIVQRLRCSIMCNQWLALDNGMIIVCMRHMCAIATPLGALAALQVADLGLDLGLEQRQDDPRC